MDNKDYDYLIQSSKEGRINLLDKEIDVIEKLKQGDESVEAYKSVIEDRYKKLKNRDKLDEKLDKEYQNFLEEIRSASKDKILSSSYELTIKEEIRLLIKSMDLHPKEVNLMLNIENILHEFYIDWLDIDIDLGEVLSYSVNDSIASVTKNYNLKEKQNKEEMEKVQVDKKDKEGANEKNI